MPVQLFTRDLRRQAEEAQLASESRQAAIAAKAAARREQVASLKRRQVEEARANWGIAFTAAAPPAQAYGVTPEGAELLVRDWMRHLGVSDAEITRYVADGGVDVRSTEFVVQVKHYIGTVSVKDVRELFGVAKAENRYPLFFTSGTFTKTALEFAASTNIPLIQYDAALGVVVGLNDFGEQVLTMGVQEAFSARGLQPRVRRAATS